MCEKPGSATNSEGLVRKNKIVRGNNNPPTSGASAGFSIAEALIAIAIAAILAVALTRLASNTRMNARNIQELLNMMNLNEALLTQVTPTAPGTVDGRTGAYSWRAVTVPMNFMAIARRVNDKSSDRNTTQAKTPGFSPVSETPTEKKPEAQTVIWRPFHVTVSIQSPAGRVYVADTLSIGSVAASKD